MLQVEATAPGVVEVWRQDRACCGLGTMSTLAQLGRWRLVRERRASESAKEIRPPAVGKGESFKGLKQILRHRWWWAEGWAGVG